MDKPWSVPVELTFGCFRKCEVCYRQVLQKPQMDFMQMEIAEITAKELQIFDPTRIKFGMRGEPTANPRWLDIVEMFREQLPKSKLILITNGDLLNKEKVEEYFSRGGNVIMMDCYDNTLKERLNEYKKFDPQVHHQTNKNPYTLQPTNEIYLTEDIRKEHSDTRMLTNLAGNMTEEAMDKYNLQMNEPLKLRCTRPFGEMVIFYNGRIGWCCMDGEEETVLWDVKRGSLHKYWNKNAQLNEIRCELYHQNRSGKLCEKCTYFGGERINRLKKPKLHCQ